MTSSEYAGARNHRKKRADVVATQPTVDVCEEIDLVPELIERDRFDGKPVRQSPYVGPHEGRSLGRRDDEDLGRHEPTSMPVRAATFVLNPRNEAAAS